MKSSAADLQLRVRGTVQGVGFRPFVQQTAERLGLRGWVLNDSEGVLIRAVGPRAAIDALAEAVGHHAPPAARVTAVDVVAVPEDTAPAGPSFVIAASGAAASTVAASVPPDLALCADCSRELNTPGDRRYAYPFINCTQCGPRYSLIEGLPYDRQRTTMRAFRMCPTCAAEYSDPRDRRFHAQPNACPSCGPQLCLFDGSGALLSERGAALAGAAAEIAAGRIVAVKGVGGFHLMCDAANETSVLELRRRKHRDEKPFAVLFPSLAALEAVAEVPAEAAAILASPQAPIVLVLRRTASAGLAPSVAPNNPWVGALLPYSPLHALLTAACGRPLVATSANHSEEPLCTDNAEALERLRGVADGFLCHDRLIARPVDDSVVRLNPRSEPIVLRRARGYAPAPLRLPGRLPHPVLCVGGQLKNTIAVAAGEQVVLSPHIGDLGNPATEEAFRRTIEMLGELHGAHYAAVVHDKHPDYDSTRHARSLGLPCVAVQHHLAHVLSCLLERSHPADGVLGVAWDGTGYGEDGTIWGGEFLLLEHRVARRFGRFRRFRLPGGAAAIRDPRRTALSLVHELKEPELFDRLAHRVGFTEREAATLRTMLERGIRSPQCSSAGRFFDAAGVLLGLGRANAFEGQLPFAVESAAWGHSGGSEALSMPVRAVEGCGAAWEVDWEPAVRELMAGPSDSGAAAEALHRGLAGAIAQVAARAGVGSVALTGGCFQNALLQHLTEESLTTAGFQTLLHRELPPGDGGIAAGQALAALWNLTDVQPG